MKFIGVGQVEEGRVVVSSSLTPQAALLVPISVPIDSVVDRQKTACESKSTHIIIHIAMSTTHYIRTTKTTTNNSSGHIF